MTLACLSHSGKTEGDAAAEEKKKGEQSETKESGMGSCVLTVHTQTAVTEQLSLLKRLRSHQSESAAPAPVFVCEREKETRMQTCVAVEALGAHLCVRSIAFTDILSGFYLYLFMLSLHLLHEDYCALNFLALGPRSLSTMHSLIHSLILTDILRPNTNKGMFGVMLPTLLRNPGFSIQCHS